MSGNKKISQLPIAGTLDGTELVPVVQNGETVHTTVQDISDLGGSSGVQTVTGANVDNTDPLNPVVNTNTEYVTGNITAENDKNYINQTGGNIYTDVPSPSVGTYYTVLVAAGTATIGSTTYSVTTIVLRYYNGSTWLSFKTKGNNTGDETVNTIGTLINGSSSATPNDTDLVATVESSVLKKITWSDVKTFLKTYFDYSYKQLQIIASATSQTAVNDGDYIVNASTTFTDPTPVEAKGYTVFVRSGTATVGGTAYSVAGTRIYRYYHSGSWSTYTSDIITQTITNGVTDKAPSEDAVYVALALKKDTVCVNCGFSATNFADSTTYYFGVFLISTATNATNTRNRFNAPFTGSVTAVYSRSYAATPTSNEDISFVLYNLTQGTSVTLGNIQFNATQINKYTGLTLACNEGDLMEYRLIVPVLATNGNGSQMQVQTIFTKS